MRYFEPKLAQHMGCMLNEYLYYFYYREKALENIKRTGETRGERIKKINDNMLQELSKYNAKTDFDKMLEIYSKYIYMRESNYMEGETSEYLEIIFALETLAEYLKNPIVKNGNEGCMYKTNGEIYVIEPLPVNHVDLLG